MNKFRNLTIPKLKVTITIGRAACIKQRIESRIPLKNNRRGKL